MQEALQTIQDLPGWAKVVGSVLSFVLAIVGFAGVPDDVRTWFRWLRNVGGWTRQGVPWWILLSISLGLLTLLWFPNLWWVWGVVSLGFAGVSWRAEETVSPSATSATPQLSGSGTTKPSSHDDLLGRIRRSELRVAELEVELTTVKGEAESARQERDHEQQGRYDAEARADEHWDKIQYGISAGQWKFMTLDDPASAAAWNDMTLLRDVIGASGAGIFNLAARLGEDMSGGDECSRMLATYIGEQDYQTTKNLHRRICESVDAAEVKGERIEYRGSLMDYYVAYNKLRKTIKKMVQIRGCDLSELKEYSDWKDADAEFLRGVWNIGAMHKHIKNVNKSRGYPVPLQD